MCLFCGNFSHVIEGQEGLNQSGTVAAGYGPTAAGAHPNPMLDGILWGGWH